MHNTASAPTMRTPKPSPWLQALVSNVQDAIVILDPDGRLIFENPSACQVLGIPSDDVLGPFGLSRIHPEEREAVVRSFRRTIEVAGSTSRATYRFQRADGGWQHLEALAKNLVDDPEIGGVLVTFRDVSERIRAIEAAESASRARDEFLYNISRELRAPIDAMLACAAGASLEPGTGPALMLDQLGRHGDHLLRLIEEAVDLAGVRNGFIALGREAFLLNIVLADATAAVEVETVRQDVRITTHLRATDAMVLGDQWRLSRVLIDLIDGLVRSSRFGGEVTISSRMEPGQVRVELIGGGGELSERRLENAFERVERLGMQGAESAGHGLGVAIAGRLIELMGGAMGVETAPGGTILVWIQLPRAERL